MVALGHGDADRVVACSSLRPGRHRHRRCGRRRLDRLFENTRYFRMRLRQLGFAVMGQDDSPVVPVLL
ncbi:MAG TPA: hypothetical protein PKD61_25095, partial [Polyangiaceae bacterium]|nr:hypothetical protein [Polyangiaceae bacterium]